MDGRYLAVPVRLIRDKNLTSMELFILIEIMQLSMMDLGCIASNNHFAELLNIKKEAVSRVIGSLEKKGYVSTSIEDGSRNHNRTITINKMLLTPKQNVNTPLTKCLETKDNNSINKTSNSVADAPAPSPDPKKKVMYSDEDMGLAVTMYHNILAMHETYKKPDLEKWANEFRLMRECDGRTTEKMDNFLNSLATGTDKLWEFWRGNILSPKSMRHNYDKVVSQYRRDVVDAKKIVNQNIPISERVKHLAEAARV